MAVNSFIAALGNILEGASSDRERTRKLKELEEEREYTRLERRQLAEDRAERRAREKQAEADRLEALGYESETVLKSRLAGLGDAPAYEPGAASFDLGMDGVASKPSVGSLKPSPFSGSRLGVIGQDPFSGAKAQGMVEGADKTEQRRETQRRLASLVDVAGQGRMYATTRAQQLAAEEQRLAGVTDRATEREREKKRIDAQVVEKQTEEARAKVIANATKFLSPEDLKALEGGVPLESLIVSKTDRARNAAMLAAAGQRAGGGVRPKTASQLTAEALLVSGESANKILSGDPQAAIGSPERQGMKDYSPSLLVEQASRLPFGVGNKLATSDYQQLRQAALQLSDAWLRTTTGAAAPEAEVRRTAQTLIPEAGDSPAVKKQKVAARETILKAMRIKAGPSISDRDELYGGVDLLFPPE